jgi:hypothetical protein
MYNSAVNYYLGFFFLAESPIPRLFSTVPGFSVHSPWALRVGGASRMHLLTRFPSSSELRDILCFKRGCGLQEAALIQKGFLIQR